MEDMTFGEFYEENKHLFPDDFNESMERVEEIRKIFFETEPNYRNVVKPQLTALMLKQYPEIATVDNPLMQEYITDINEQFSYTVIWAMNRYVKEFRAGTDLKQAYPKLEKWREFYCDPEAQHKITPPSREYEPDLTDEEWVAFEAEEMRLMLQFRQWKLNRQQAFYDIVQPPLFAAFPELQNLEGDQWVIYAMAVRDAYEEWKTFCGRLEHIVEFNLPLESFYWDSKEYFAAQKGITSDMLRASSDKRDKRIAEDMGEMREPPAE